MQRAQLLHVPTGLRVGLLRPARLGCRWGGTNPLIVATAYLVELALQQLDSTAVLALLHDVLRLRERKLELRASRTCRRSRSSLRERNCYR